jgi:predicted ATPase
MKPLLFIGSSTEKSPVMDEIARQLRKDADIRPWTNIFALTQPYFTSLMKQAGEADFGVFVFAPDDVTTLRQRQVATVRDNVVFELGLFLGKLGPEHCVVVSPRPKKQAKEPTHFPTDLAGVKFAEYRTGIPLSKALQPICSQIRAVLRGKPVLAQGIQGEWLEIKEKVHLEHPFAIVRFSREGKAVKVNGTSYDYEGKLHVTWPDKMSFCGETFDGIYHCYDASIPAQGVANGISYFSFTAGEAPPQSGHGYYVAHVDGSGMASGKTNFKLKRLTPEFRAFLLGNRWKTASETELIRQVAHLYRTKRIAITGGPCSGKTALVDHFAAQRHVVVEEAARLIMDQHVERLGSAEAFRKWRARHMSEFQSSVFDQQRHLERAVPLNCPTLYLDRSGIDGIAYLRNARQPVPNELLRYARDMVFASVFVLPTLPKAIFAERYETGRADDYGKSKAMGDLLAETYREFGHPVVQVPSGLTVEERMQFIHRTVEPGN